MMDKKEQIEEMAKVLCCDYNENCHKACCHSHDCYVEEDCRTLYNAGYRKQREWKELVQEQIMSLIPETIDTEAGTHIHLLYQERLIIAKAVADGLVRPFPGEGTK